MKAYAIKITLLLMTALCGNGQTASETSDAERRPEIAAGIGYARAMAALSLKNFGLYEGKNDFLFSEFESPVFTLDYAHPVKNSMAFGPAISLQSLRVRHMKGDMDNHTIAYHELLRINFGLRLLYEKYLNTQFKLYGGVRAGVTGWIRTLTPEADFRINHSPVPSMQVLGGARRMFGKLGVGFEAAIGTAPYLLQMNAAYRF